MRKRPNSQWWALAIVAIALSNQACTASTPKPSAPPPAHQARKAHEPAEEEPYHVAPPPAYGNKVVLAKADEN
jgi:hypothetical protein